MQKPRRKKSCGQIIRDTILKNQQRTPEQLFSQFEMDARREQLIGTDAPTREKEKQA